MDLVSPVPSDHPGYVLDVNSAALAPGKAGRLKLLVRNRGTDAIVRHFHWTHERAFHLFVVSQDLEFFAHLHPEVGSDGAVEVDVSLPASGVYYLIADVFPVGGRPQLLQHSLVTSGYSGYLLRPLTRTVDVADKTINRTRVRLTMPDAIAGREQLVTLEFQEEPSGQPVINLERYLGAVGHLFYLSEDGQFAAHMHPVEQLAVDPSTIVFQLVFPRSGLYRLWTEFQRDGEVLTAPFTVAVRDGERAATMSR